MLFGAKILVFALFCAAGAINPFITLVLQDKNFTAAETGTLISLSKLVSLLLTPVICAVADAYRCHVPLLVGVSLAASALMLLWWGAMPVHRAGLASTPATVRGPGAGNGFDWGNAVNNEEGLVDMTALATAALHMARSAEASPAALTAPTKAASGVSRSAKQGGGTAGTNPATVMDASAVVTALLLGLYYAISGSKTVITDTLVMKQIDQSIGGGSSPGGGRAVEETPSTPSLATEGTEGTEGGLLTERRDSGSATAATVGKAFAEEAVAAAQQRKDLAADAAYPMQRLWGSISYGCSASLTGVLVKLLSSAIATSRASSPTPPQPHMAAAKARRGTQTPHTRPLPATEKLSTKPYLSVPLLHALSLLIFAAVVVVVTRKSRGGKTVRRRGAMEGERAMMATPSSSAANGVGLEGSALLSEREEPLTSQRARSAVLSASSPSASHTKPAAFAAEIGGSSDGAVGACTATAASLSKQHTRQRQVTTAAAPTKIGDEPSALPSGGDAKLARAPASRWSEHAVHMVRLCVMRCRGLGTVPASVRTTLQVYLHLLRSPRFVFPLFFGVFFLTLAEMTTWIFLFPYARRELHASPQLFSLIMLVHLASEVAAFAVGSFLLQRKRLSLLFFTSAMCYSVKLHGYSVVRDVRWLLFVELLHGPCAAFRLTGTVAHVTACAREAERHFTGVQQHPGSAKGMTAVRETSLIPPLAEPLFDTSKDDSSLVRNREETAVVVLEGLPAAELKTPFVDAVTAGMAASPPSTSLTIASALAQGEPEQKVELLATAYSIMWFAATGLPMALTGMLPVVISAAFSGSAAALQGVAPTAMGGAEFRSPTVGSLATASLPTSTEPMELRLFRCVSLLLLAVAFLFLTYHRLRMFS